MMGGKPTREFAEVKITYVDRAATHFILFSEVVRLRAAVRNPLSGATYMLATYTVVFQQGGMAAATTGDRVELDLTEIDNVDILRTFTAAC
jgi:hypothetical protein